MTSRATAAAADPRAVPPADPRAVPPADPEAVARAICLRLLTTSARTRAQLRAALDRRKVPAEVAERVLDRLTDVGLIDDRAYAEAWVSSRQAGRGLARRALGAELRARGVDEAVVAATLDGVDPDAERQRAVELVRRRAAATAGLARPARERRLAGMLARKGYPPALAALVVREVLGAEVAADGGSP